MFSTVIQNRFSYGTPLGHFIVLRTYVIMLLAPATERLLCTVPVYQATLSKLMTLLRTSDLTDRFARIKYRPRILFITLCTTLGQVECVCPAAGDVPVVILLLSSRWSSPHSLWGPTTIFRAHPSVPTPVEAFHCTLMSIGWKSAFTMSNWTVNYIFMLHNYKPNHLQLPSSLSKWFHNV